jgi:hypothetical protein
MTALGDPSGNLRRLGKNPEKHEHTIEKIENFIVLNVKAIVTPRRDSRYDWSLTKWRENQCFKI